MSVQFVVVRSLHGAEPRVLDCVLGDAARLSSALSSLTSVGTVSLDSLQPLERVDTLIDKESVE